jgi:orotate phosphoribosyltransferase
VAASSVIEVLRACYSHVEVAGRDGARGVGVTNLKRVFGRPADLQLLVGALGATIRGVEAIASSDTGSSPLAAVVAFQLGLPAMFTNPPQLAGERLRPGTTVHLIDDLVHSGRSMASAARLLRAAGLELRGASCLLVAPETTGWRATLAAAGIDQLGALAATTEL